MNDKDEEETIDEDQVKTLDYILKQEDKISVKVPKDEFNDEKELELEKKAYSSGESKSGTESKTKIIKKYGYSFNIDGFESNSIAYFREVLLGYKNKANCFHVNFNFNEFLKIDIPTIEICKKMLVEQFELKGDIDGVINNVQKNELLEAIKENKYSIFTSRKFFKDKSDVYDIFCESTFGFIDKLKRNSGEKPNQKIQQLEKLIYLIKLIDEINNKYKKENLKSNDMSISMKIGLKNRINSIFHHNEGNKIILCIIVDGNYKNLILQIKNSCLFSKEWKETNPSDNLKMDGLYKYFGLLRKSRIPFLIVFCPRFYERKSDYFNPISKTYLEDKQNEADIQINNLTNENAMQREQINNLTKENAMLNQQITDLKVNLKQLEDKFKAFEDKKKRKKEKERSNLLGKKIGRKITAREKFKVKSKKKSNNDDSKK